MTNERHETALEAAELEWIEWKGGECPVDPDTIVDVRDADGTVWIGLEASFHDWCEMPDFLRNEAVAAYRLHAPNHFTNGE